VVLSMDPGSIVLYGTGWKNISLVDVYNSVTFTLWLCGCNLRCPFCHNWRLAISSRDICRRIDVGKLVSELESSKPFIDYFHITGGEPLAQFRQLVELLQVVKGMDVPVSLNTNLTLLKPLKYAVEKRVVDHVATDLKTPFRELSGLGAYSNSLWRLYIKSLKLVVEYSIPLELRVPVARELTLRSIRGVLEELLPVISRHIDKTVVVVNPLLTKPLVEPRDIEWCSRYCLPSSGEVEEVASVFRERGFKTVVKEVPA